MQAQDTYDEEQSIFFVAQEENINNNNLNNETSAQDAFGPYSFVDLSFEGGKPYRRKSAPEAGVPMCDMCYAVLSSYSELYKHKAKPCYEACEKLQPPYPHPIKIRFLEDQLFYIGDVIRALGFPLQEEEEQAGTQKIKYVIVDESMFEITLRRFYNGQITKYNLEQWYPALHSLAADCTPKTLFMPLSDAELKLLQSLASVVLARNLGMGSRETQKELEGREKLEDKITAMMKEAEGEEGSPEENKPVKPWFCRMSTRSPKDSVSSKRANQENKDETDAAKRLNVKNAALKVTNGFEAMELLTKSQRVFSDISQHFQYRVAGSTSGQLCLILREWMDGLRQDHEFRCFVHNRTLNAISQYHCYSRFESLQDAGYLDRIREAIIACHDRIKDAVPMPSYVVDIAVLPDWTCQVIELNPFGTHMSSGAALYNWATDVDLLYGRLGRKTPAIRVLKELIPSPSHNHNNN